MGLKQSIIIKSEYTNNARSAPGRGSRGASPGQYVMRYMAREDATEVLAPVRVEAIPLDGFAPLQINDGSSVVRSGYNSALFARYMARMDATEQLKLKQDTDLQDADAYGSPLVLKHKFKRIDKLSGRAFGSKGLSLSQTDLQASSDTIQKAFDEGHSVQKIIVSFTEDYLRETGVLNPAFKHKGRGSYKGHIDQLKLREAITRGVNGMLKAGGFVKPEWVGTIQLDTSHVHAHLALVDTEFARTRMRDDGADRGKINEREKKMFRKGIHFGLEDMKELKSFHKQASLERQNVVSFVKDYAYTTLYENTSVQLLIAGLPKDRRLWRYGTNNQTMKHSNKLATKIVERVFQQEPEDSGYAEAMRAVHRYANESTVKNRLDSKGRQQLIDTGRERIMERSVNGLYNVLKAIPPERLQTRTEMIDIQSSSDDVLAQALKQSSRKSSDFDPAAFMLRVRGYNKRQDVHAQEAKDYFKLASEYDAAKDEGLVNPTAHVMRLFYEEELRYHMSLTDKYRTFLSFHHQRDRQAVTDMQPAYTALVKRFDDIVSDEAETGLTLTEDRVLYQRDLRVYTFDCFERGVASVKEWDAITDYDSENGTLDTRFVLPVRPKTRAENLTKLHFDNVKAFDVHHLGLDYYNKPDARIDAKNARVFADVYDMRKQRAEAAQVYATSTNQRLPALERAWVDIEQMEVSVEKAVRDGLIQTVTLSDLTQIEERQLYTLSLDTSVDVTKQVRRTLEDMDDLDVTSPISLTSTMPTNSTTERVVREHVRDLQEDEAELE